MDRAFVRRWSTVGFARPIMRAISLEVFRSSSGSRQARCLFVNRDQRSKSASSLTRAPGNLASRKFHGRSEEHTSELQSLMRISYAVFCLKKKNTILYTPQHPLLPHSR